MGDEPHEGAHAFDISVLAPTHDEAISELDDLAHRAVYVLARGLVAETVLDATVHFGPNYLDDFAFEFHQVEVIEDRL